ERAAGRQETENGAGPTQGPPRPRPSIQGGMRSCLSCYVGLRSAGSRGLFHDHELYTPVGYRRSFTSSSTPPATLGEQPASTDKSLNKHFCRTYRACPDRTRCRPV